MKGKITFNKSGSGSKSARLTIPAALIELLIKSSSNKESSKLIKSGQLLLINLSICR